MQGASVEVVAKRDKWAKSLVPVGAVVGDNVDIEVAPAVGGLLNLHLIYYTVCRFYLIIVRLIILVPVFRHVLAVGSTAEVDRYIALGI